MDYRAENVWGKTHDMNEEKTKQKRKRYDEGFKRAAVEHWLSSGKAAETVAAEYSDDFQQSR